MLFDRRSAERLRVLVVEPRDLVAARLKTQLETLGHWVLGFARDGEEAVTAAERLQPSLILMDAKLPGRDGIDTARTILSSRPVPIVLLTGYTGAELVRRAREAGVVAYLTSVDQRQLVSAISVALERFGESRILRREGSDPSEALATGRLVDRAKKVLMARLGLSEAGAFQHILERKQSTRRSLRETTWTIIEAEEVLSRHDFARCLETIFNALRPNPKARALSTRAARATALRTASPRAVGSMI